MTVAYKDTGTVATGTTSLAIPHPTSGGVILAGELLVVAICSKHPDYGPADISGWTKLTSDSSGLADGVDDGDSRATIFYKVAAGGESGDVTVTLTSCSTCVGRMFRYTKTGTSWVIGSAIGAQNTKVDPWTTTNAVTATSDPGLTAGDVLLMVVAFNVNVCTMTLEAVTATGITVWGTMAERQDSGTNNGNDCALIVSEHPVTTGTSSAAPVFAGDPSTTVAGGVLFFRMREYTPTAYSLNVDPGSYTATGVASGTLADRIMEALPSSYAVSGINAILAHGYQFGADPGGYDLTGVSAGTIADRMIYASPSNYTVTGVTAAILAQRLLNVNPGDYAITGINTTLDRGYFISVDGGVYTITGNEATLLAQRLISTDIGTYLITGSDAQILADRLLNAEIETYAVTGFVADLVHGGIGAYVLTAEPGSYLVFGTDTGLLATRILNANPGGYIITGQEAITLAQRLISANPGTYGLTGFDAEFLRSTFEYFLNAEPGSYLIVGSEAKSILGRMLSANPGAYTVTGQEAVTIARRVLNAGAGDYILTGRSTSLLANRTLNCNNGIYILSGSDANLIYTGLPSLIKYRNFLICKPSAPMGRRIRRIKLPY